MSDEAAALVTGKEYKQENNNTTNIKSFHYLEDGSVSHSIIATKYSTKELEKGIYNLKTIPDGSKYAIDLTISKDKELFEEDLEFYYEDKVRNIYTKFFFPEIRDKIHMLGYNHKLGILLYGKQGTGKTSMFKKYFNDAVNKHNAIVFNITSTYAFSLTWEFIQKIRTIQDTPIIVFMDEFDEFFAASANFETVLKRILDGTDSIDNCMFMMTTNYIDKIPSTIKDRPSRIKYKIEVTGIQDEKLIGKFLEQSFQKIGLEVDFKDDLPKMKGWTIDELKQWVLDKIMEIEPEEKITGKLGF